VEINALPKEWDAFASSICARKETPSFEEFWVQCTIEEIKIKARNNTQPIYEASQAFAAKSKKKFNKQEDKQE